MENEKIMNQNDQKVTHQKFERNQNIFQNEDQESEKSPRDKSDDELVNPIKEESELTEEQKVTAQLADNLVELLAKQSQNTEEKCKFLSKATFYFTKI